MRFSVLVTESLSQEGLDHLEQGNGIEMDIRLGCSRADLLAMIHGYQGLIVRSGTLVDAALLEHAKNLKVVGRAGTGLDNIDLVETKKRGIDVLHTPSANADSAAEHTIALLFALLRHIPQAHGGMKAGLFEKSKWMGMEAAGKTLGIIGLGHVGQRVAQLALGLRMRVIGYDPFVSMDLDLGIEQKQKLEDVFAQADILTFHVQLSKETHHLLHPRNLSCVKPGALILNVSRGGVVHEQALLHGLNCGQIQGAALDVFEVEPPPLGHPLVEHPRVVCTPHLGASTYEAQSRVSLEMAKCLLEWIQKNNRPLA